MIVDLNLQGRKMVVIGGGNEAQKRINSALKQGCDITVISDRFSEYIERLGTAKKIRLSRQRISDTQFIPKMRPDLIITATDDGVMNRRIVRDAKKRGITVYSSDNPEESDFSNPAVINFEDTVQVAIFTGRKSPAMSKKIKERAEILLKKIVTEEDIAQIRIQGMARELAKEAIPDKKARRDCLVSITEDVEIERLIKDGQVEKAERRAGAILRNWR